MDQLAVLVFHKDKSVTRFELVKIEAYRARIKFEAL